MVKHFASGAEDLVRRRIKRVALTAGAANAFAFAWQNPEDKAIMVTRVVIDVTTSGGTSGSYLSVGSAASATTQGINLLDVTGGSVTLYTVGVYDNLGNAGTNGKSRQKVDIAGGTAAFVTGRILTQNALTLVGYAYIEYFVVED